MVRESRLTFNVAFDDRLPEFNMMLVFNNMAAKDLIFIKITSEDIGCRQLNLLDIAVDTMFALIDLTQHFTFGDLKG